MKDHGKYIAMAVLMFFLLAAACSAPSFMTYAGEESGGVDEDADSDAGKVMSDSLFGTGGGMISDQKVVSFDLSGYSQDGKRKWEVKGESANMDGDIVKVDRVEASSYDEKTSARLTALKGEISKMNKNLHLRDNVTVVTSDGIRLTTESLEWLSKTNEVITDDFIVVEKDNMYSSGKGARVDIEAKTVMVYDDIFVKQGELMIVCRGPLEIVYEERKATFFNDVKVTEPRGELLADRLDVFFDPDSRQIEKIMAEGDVQIRQQGNVARGQRAVYTMSDGRAILTGSPTITITSDEGVKDALAGD